MNKKVIGFIVLAIIILSVVAFIKNRQSQDKEKGTEVLNTEQTEEQKKARVDSMLAVLNRERYAALGSRIERFSAEDYFSSSIKAAEGGGELAEIKELLLLAQNDTAYAKQAMKWKALLIQKQIQAYPILRKAWAADAKERMWENDIDVNVSGAGNTVLTFIGGTFAANKNKSDMMDAISPAMHNLRFKQVNYKWYAGEDGYTYYKIDSPKDSDF